MQGLPIDQKGVKETKYHPVSAEGVLVGYEHDNFNYLIFDLKTKKLVTSHDVTFVEDEFPFELEKPIISTNSTTQKKTVKYKFFDDTNEESGSDTEVRVTPNSVTDPPDLDRSVNQNSQDPSLRVTPSSVRLESTTEGRDSVTLDPTIPLSAPPYETLSSPEPDINQLPPTPQVRASRRIKNKTVSYRGMCNLAEITHNNPTFDCLPQVFNASALPFNDEPPKSLKSALTSFDGKHWQKAC